ncbi:hypothetical protein LMH66_07210 [Shewanella sp. 10N.7]|uniref:hypothetical protein n=1 Tax=Shewanella sp. 10N.7 TaxID=2885093 RepID=UPI001E558768|nr:hypothetical protein [Shewanella sp. 10N.7]MCC4832418.1 hypothetical protein [Shewanella sp. 10N.7]
MKEVVNGIYETNKMKVEIRENIVSKTFKKVGNYSKRYTREKTSLQRLSESSLFPKLVSFDDKTNNIKMSRIPGSQPESLSENQIDLLRQMVKSMHDAGVARHAIPIRDLLSSNDKELGMVDFERVTLKRFSFSPIWLIAKKVSNYHLCRLMKEHQSHLLSESEQIFLEKINKIRNTLQKIKHIKSKLKSLFS